MAFGLDDILGFFSGGGGSSVPSVVEPDVLGSAAQTAANTGGTLDAAGGIIPAAISGSNPASFLDAASSGSAAFQPGNVGGPPPLTPGDVATNPALGQMGTPGGGAASASTEAAKVGGVAPTLTNAPTAPPTPPSVTTPGTEASRQPGNWWSTMGNNALNQVQRNPWTTAGIGLGLAGNLAAMGQGQPSGANTKAPNANPFPAGAPTAPSVAPPPLSEATNASPLFQSPAKGGMQVQNPWSGLTRPTR